MRVRVGEWREDRNEVFTAPKWLQTMEGEILGFCSQHGVAGVIVLSGEVFMWKPLNEIKPETKENASVEGTERVGRSPGSDDGGHTPGVGPTGGRNRSR